MTYTPKPMFEPLHEIGEIRLQWVDHNGQGSIQVQEIWDGAAWLRLTSNWLPIDWNKIGSLSQLIQILQVLFRKQIFEIDNADREKLKPFLLEQPTPTKP